MISEGGKKVESKVLSIMFVDIVSYTSTTSRLDREGIDKLHEIFDGICLPVFDAFLGRVIKKIGDAFLVAFESPTDAVLCGIRLQKAFFKYRSEYNGNLHIRVAIHSGEVVERKGDLYGDAVNTTARIEGIVKADDVVFSRVIFESMNRNGIPFKSIGKHRFKGVAVPMELFKILTRRDIEETKRRERDAKIRKVTGGIFSFFKTIFALILIILFLCILVYLFFIFVGFQGIFS